MTWLFDPVTNDFINSRRMKRKVLSWNPVKDVQDAAENVGDTVTGKKKQGTRPKTNVPGISNPGQAAIGSSGGNVPAPSGPKSGTIDMPEGWGGVETTWRDAWGNIYDGTFSGENVATSAGHATGAGPSRTIPPESGGGGYYPNQSQINVGEHLGTAPVFGDIYGDGGFGYERESFEFDEEGYYDPTKLGSEGYDLTSLDEMNFDPYRRNALQDVTATSASDQASAEGAMARSGGLSASDRMAMASQFNRDKISGRSGALGKYDEFEAQNIYDVGNRNAAIDNEAAAWNAQQQTIRDQSASDLAHETGIKEAEAENLYRKNEQTRKYQEKLDQYNADLEKWYLEGQFMAGGAVMPEKPKPPVNIGEDDEGPGEDHVAGVPRPRRTPTQRAEDKIQGATSGLGRFKF